MFKPQIFMPAKPPWMWGISREESPKLPNLLNQRKAGFFFGVQSHSFIEDTLKNWALNRIVPLPVALYRPGPCACLLAHFLVTQSLYSNSNVNKFTKYF
jgi:hypothetical protein